MSEIETVARRMCALDGCDPDAEIVDGYWYYVLRNDGERTPKAWQEIRFPAWKRYEAKAHAFLKCAPPSSGWEDDANRLLIEAKASGNSTDGPADQEPRVKSFSDLREASPDAD